MKKEIEKEQKKQVLELENKILKTSIRNNIEDYNNNKEKLTSQKDHQTQRMFKLINTTSQ